MVKIRTKRFTTHSTSVHFRTRTWSKWKSQSLHGYISVSLNHILLKFGRYEDINIINISVKFYVCAYEIRGAVAFWIFEVRVFHAMRHFSGEAPLNEISQFMFYRAPATMVCVFALDVCFPAPKSIILLIVATRVRTV